MKYTLLIVVFFLVGCIGSDYDYRISFMFHKNLSYEELPVKIQNCLSDRNISDSLYEAGDGFLLIDEEVGRYKFESVFTGPWVDYDKIIDTQKNITYRVERTVPLPFIIYKEKLYVADQYNYRTLHLREATYSEYKLK
jgi:hypothetical protein